MLLFAPFHRMYLAQQHSRMLSADNLKQFEPKAGPTVGLDPDPSG